jgi:hypothetical protein
MTPNSKHITRTQDDTLNRSQSKARSNKYSYVKADGKGQGVSQEEGRSIVDNPLKPYEEQYFESLNKSKDKNPLNTSLDDPNNLETRRQQRDQQSTLRDP